MVSCLKLCRIADFCGYKETWQQYITYIYNEKDTALAWFIPTNTATHLMTELHSLLQHSSSPSFSSKQGYSSPITAEKTAMYKYTQLGFYFIFVGFNDTSPH